MILKINMSKLLCAFTIGYACSNAIASDNKTHDPVRHNPSGSDCERIAMEQRNDCINFHGIHGQGGIPDHATDGKNCLLMYEKVISECRTRAPSSDNHSRSTENNNNK